MPVVTHPMGNIAREIFDSVVRAIGAAKASRWFFSGQDDLGGRSPIGALKERDEYAVRVCASKLICKSRKNGDAA